MFTFTNKEVGSLLTNEKCFNDLYDLYKNRNFKKKLVLVLENRIAYELPLKMISVKWAVVCAERCLHILEEVRPNDNRPRKAIEAAKQWIIDPTIDIVAVNAAAYAAFAAAADVGSINSYAANAAYAAAYSAHAAKAAADVASINSYTATAVYAAAAAVYATEQKWSRNKLKEIVGEYFNDYRSDLKNTLIVQVNIILELSDIIIKYVI